MILRNMLDLFDTHFPGGSVVLDHIRRARIDIRSLFRAFKPWHDMETKRPLLTVEVANICNSNCLFCAYRYQDRFRRGKGIMSDKLFEKALNDYHNMGGHFVGFTPFAGEPLLDPNIIERISRAHALGFWSGFFTNGIRLNHIDVQKLLQSGIDALAVSVSPLERSMYELLYRNKHYDDVLQGLRKLLVARNLVRPDFTVHITFRSHIPMKQVLALPDLRRVILPLLTPEDRRNLIVNTRGFDTWGGQIKDRDMVGIMRLALPPLIKRRPCSWTWGLYVTWDGQVRACACRFIETENKDGKDDLYLGNIKKSSLSDIWHGKVIKRLRRRFQDGDLPLLCKRCTMYRAC